MVAEIGTTIGAIIAPVISLFVLYITTKSKVGVEVIKNDMGYLKLDITNIKDELKTNTMQHQVLNQTVNTINTEQKSLIKQMDFYVDNSVAMHDLRSILTSELSQVQGERASTVLTAKVKGFLSIVESVISSLSKSPAKQWLGYKTQLYLGYNDAMATARMSYQDDEKFDMWALVHFKAFEELIEDLQEIFYSSKNNTASKLIDEFRRFGVKFIQDGNEYL